MTTETDVKQRLTALYAVLAAATNPDGSARFEGFRQPCPAEWISVPSNEPIPHDDIGRSHHLKSNSEECVNCGPVALREFINDCPNYVKGLACPDCNGPDWQVRAGGLAAGLAGLDPKEQEGSVVALELSHWLRCTNDRRHYKKDGVECRLRLEAPTEAEIDEAGLRLVCQVAGLEVPCAS